MDRDRELDMDRDRELEMDRDIELGSTDKDSGTLPSTNRDSGQIVKIQSVRV